MNNQTNWADFVVDPSFTTEPPRRLGASTRAKPTRGRERGGVIRGTTQRTRSPSARRIPQPITIRVRGTRGRSIPNRRRSPSPVRRGARVTNIQGITLDSLIRRQRILHPGREVGPTDRVSRPRAYSNVVIVHNFSRFELERELSFDQAAYQMYLTSPQNLPTGTRLVTIIGGKRDPIQTRSQKEKNLKKQKQDLYRENVRAKHKFRELLLNEANIACSNCGNSKSFRTVRHSNGIREFRLVEVADWDKRFESLQKAIEDVLSENTGLRATSSVVGDPQANQILAQRFEGNPITWLSFEEYEPVVSSTTEIDLAKERQHMQEFLFDLHNQKQEDKENEVLSRVFSWLRHRNPIELSKDKWKLKNQLSGLLKYRPSILEVKQRAVQLIPHLDPALCKACGGFCLLSLSSGKCKYNTELLEPIFLEKIPLSEELRQVLNHVMDQLSGQKDLPNSIVALCNTVELCCNITQELDFNRVFDRLVELGAVTEIDYQLQYELSKIPNL